MSTPTFTEVFHQIKVNFKVIGVPLDKSGLTVQFYLLIICICLTIIEETAFLVHNMAPENFLELTGLAPCLCVGTLSVLKLIPVVLKRETVFALADQLNRLSTEIINDPKKKKVVHRDIELLRTLIKYYFMLNAVLVCVYNFSPPVFMSYHYITTGEEVFLFPFAIIIPFSTELWSTWSLIYLHSITSGFLCILYFTTVDAIYFILTSYVCSNFAVLSDEIQKLDTSTDWKLEEFVKRHQYILKLADDLEVIFKLPNFFNVLVGAMELCALGFNILMAEWSGVPGTILFILSVLLQLFMISVFGEKLIQESTKVGDAVYLCEWYKMNKKSKKTILLLMSRSCKAQQLTANKFSVICYNGFTRIMSNSWAYFTILRTIYSPPTK